MDRARPFLAGIAGGLLLVLAADAARGDDTFAIAPELEGLEATTLIVDGELVIVAVSRRVAGDNSSGNRLDAFRVPLDDPQGMQRAEIPTSPSIFSLGRRIQRHGPLFLTALVDDFKPVVLSSNDGLVWHRTDIDPTADCLEVELVRSADQAVLSCADGTLGTLRFWTAPWEAAPSSLGGFVEIDPLLPLPGSVMVPAFFGGDRHTLAPVGEDGSFAVSFTTTPYDGDVDPFAPLSRLFVVRHGDEQPEPPASLGSVPGPGDFVPRELMETDSVNVGGTLVDIGDLIPEVMKVAWVRLGDVEIDAYTFDGANRSGPARVQRTLVDTTTGTVRQQDSGCPPSSTVPRSGGPRIDGFRGVMDALLGAVLGNPGLVNAAIGDEDSGTAPPFDLRCDPDTFLDTSVVDPIADELQPTLTIASAESLVRVDGGAAALAASWGPGLGEDAAPNAGDLGTLFRHHRILVATGPEGGLRLQRYSPPCRATANALCLHGGRFRVAAFWNDPASGARFAQAVPLTEETGAFWFFDRDNLEIALKVLDGTEHTGHFWTYYGSLSDVEFAIVLTDTQTGYVRVFHNPAGRFASVGTVEALPGGGDLAAFRPAFGSRYEVDSLRSAATAPFLPVAANDCASDADAVCLNDGRFAVRLEWSDSAGNSGAGTPVALTDDTAYFWFLDEKNVEVVLKVLDARPVNGKFWVYYASLSDLRFTVTVTDTVTGAVKRYENPLGQQASAGDVDAFPGS